MADPKQNPSFDDFMQQQKSAPSFDQFMQQQGDVNSRLFGPTQTGTISANPGFFSSVWQLLKSAYANIGPFPKSGLQIVGGTTAALATHPAETRAVFNEAPKVGGMVGGLLGNVPGAIVGGSTGQLLKRSYQAAETDQPVPTTPLRAAADVGGQGLVQGGLQLAGNAIPAAWRVGTLARAGAMPEAGRLATFLRGTLNPETLPQLPKVVPQFVKDYLSKLPTPANAKPITLTAGEMSRPGFIQSAEPIAARTASSAGVVGDFLANRQRVLQANAGQLLKQTLPFGTEPLPNVGLSIQERAAQAMRDVAESRAQLQEAIAQRFSGQGPVTATEAGSKIADAVQRYHSAVDALESKLYEGQVMGPAAQRGVGVSWQQAGPLAEQMLREAQAAERAGGSTIPPQLKNMLQVISGREARERAAQSLFGGDYYTLSPTLQQEANKAAQADLEHSFTAASQARSAVMTAKRQLERQGQFDSNALRSFGQLDQAMTGDLEQALPSDLLENWRQARSLTAQQKAQFRSPLLSSIMNQQKPVAPEGIIGKVLKSGSESEAKSLMDIIGNNGDAVAGTRRAALDVLNKQRNPLQAIEARPGLRHIFGDETLAEIKAVLQSEAAEAASPQQALYQSFLKSVAGAQTPETLLDKALRSDAYASRLQQLTAADPSLKRNVSWDLMRRVLDNSTKGGRFGSDGAVFDPVLFSQNLREAMPALSRFADPAALRDTARFADAIKYLHLRHQVTEPAGSVASYWNAIQTVTGLGGLYKGLLSGLAHKPLQAVADTAGGTLGIFSPRIFTKLLLNPTSARLLAEGSRMSPVTRAQAMGALMRLGQIAQDEISDQQPVDHQQMSLQGPK